LARLESHSAGPQRVTRGPAQASGLPPAQAGVVGGETHRFMARHPCALTSAPSSPPRNEQKMFRTSTRGQVDAWSCPPSGGGRAPRRPPPSFFPAEGGSALGAI